MTTVEATRPTTGGPNPHCGLSPTPPPQFVEGAALGEEWGYARGAYATRAALVAAQVAQATRLGPLSAPRPAPAPPAGGWGAGDVPPPPIASSAPASAPASCAAVAAAAEPPPPGADDAAAARACAEAAASAPRFESFVAAGCAAGGEGGHAQAAAPVAHVTPEEVAAAFAGRTDKMVARAAVRAAVAAALARKRR